MDELLLAWYRRNRRELPWRADTRSVRDPRQRGDAAADPGRPGRSPLRGLARALADRPCARGCAGRRRDPRLAGARVQQARARAPPGRTGRRTRRLATRSDRSPRRRAVHRGCDPELRARRGHSAARCQRRAGGAPDGPRLHGRLGPGADGSRRHRLPRADPALRAVPARGTMPVPRGARRAAAQAEPLRGVVPRAASDHVATRRRAARPRAGHSTARPWSPSSGTGSPSSTTTARSRFRSAKFTSA